ncbi:MAG: M15 family metallopeptidase [Campylobacter sp.]|nr:M15 family metallopeptidase [Campylobacter sp.]
MILLCGCGLQTASNSSENSQNSKIISLQKAYNVKVVDNFVVFKDGEKIIYDDGKFKDENELLANADIEDTLSIDYAKTTLPPTTDIGRVRNYALLDKIYGKSKDEIEANLVDIIWLKDSVNKKLKFNSQNGAANALQKASDELNELTQKEPSMLEFLDNPAGTYNYRFIASTNRLSAHSYAISIDINYAKSHYWLHQKSMTYQNSIPKQIVEIFEKHGFIWGGKWKYYDTMHFEYRPEFFVKP